VDRGLRIYGYNIGKTINADRVRFVVTPGNALMVPVCSLRV
jgi:hypothetical protein